MKSGIRVFNFMNPRLNAPVVIVHGGQLRADRIQIELHAAHDFGKNRHILAERLEFLFLLGAIFIHHARQFTNQFNNIFSQSRFLSISDIRICGQHGRGKRPDWRWAA
jgi:hypothetical protein